MIAGKDRTGVFAAIVLALAGAPRELIAHDYELTRIGIEVSLFTQTSGTFNLTT